MPSLIADQSVGVRQKNELRVAVNEPFYEPWTGNTVDFHGVLE